MITFSSKQWRQINLSSLACLTVTQAMADSVADSRVSQPQPSCAHFGWEQQRQFEDTSSSRCCHGWGDLGGLTLRAG